MGDLIAGLTKKAQLEDEGEKGPIRVFETHNNKMYKELPREYNVANITDYISIVAERVPEEEINTDPAHFIYAFHFQNEPSKPHGIPFRFHIKAVSLLLPKDLMFSTLICIRMKNLARPRNA